MEAKRAQFSPETRKMAVELRKAEIPLKKIRDQLQMSASIRKRLLAHATDHLGLSDKPQKMRTWR
jgi:hypothetical protein